MIQWPNNNQGYDILDNFLNEEEYNHYYDVCKRVYDDVLQFPNHKNYCWNNRDDLNLNKIEGACKFEPEFLSIILDYLFHIISYFIVFFSFIKSILFISSRNLTSSI